MLEALVANFWTEKFWLPPNTTWADIAPGPDKEVVYNDYRHVFIPIPLAFGFIFLRFMLEKYVYSPFGKSLGVQDSRPRKAPPNSKLEEAYKAKPKLKQFSGLAKQLDMTERQVERWWRLRRSQDKPSTLVKFCENVWWLNNHVVRFVYGLIILWNKDWVWDLDLCHIGHPHQGITKDVWWYYMLSWSFYWAILVTQFRDVRRSDFYEMIVHHIATLILFVFGWICNFHRLGCIVVLIHDVSEIFLEAAKGAKYANYQKLCDFLFVVFVLSWIVSRIIVFPSYILWSCLFRRPVLAPMFPAFYLINVLLCILMVLHLIWTWTIVQIAKRAIMSGKAERDIRSSSSEMNE